MDPLTAFSLTCGVIQVVDFSTKVVVKCRQIYKDGVTSENKETEFMARHLTDLATDLKLRDTMSAHQLCHDDQELLGLAERCSETATELKKELQKLSISGRQRKRDAVRKAIKVAWKKDAIENIQNSLEQYRRTLDTRILINLRQHVHLISSEHSDNIKNLDRKIQNLIIGVSQDQKTFDELKDVINAENASNKAHISQEFQKNREIIAKEDSYKRLLESLYFPDIDARQEGIDEAHKNTFEWIFDKSGNEVQPWHPFIDWLENGHGTYWICGKAGSGKSTLMNLLCQDSRTEAALRIWSGTNKVFMPNFFFWGPGSQLQKSLAGLLRSLIYQIMESFPDLMPVLATSMDPSQHGFHQLPTWTEQRLRATLQVLLSAGLEQYRLCIFIDGLDEFQGNHATLLDLIRNLREVTQVKFCLSSRPYPAFRNELGSSPMLKLQDLTEPDIRRYVSDKLEGVPLKASQAAYSSFKIEDTIDTIIWKAEGVFLWVNLAVRDQLEGIRNGDDVEQLQERLQILPTEIEEVYGHMLQGIDKVYRKEVARYIRLALGIEAVWSLCEFALAQHKRIDDILLLSPDISISDVYQHCKSVRERIDATCKGLLEVREGTNLEKWQNLVTAPSDDAENSVRTFSESLKDQGLSPKQCEELIEMKHFDANIHVDFLHRTAFDFFTDNNQGKEFLRMYASANPHPEVLYVKARLAKLIVFPLPSDDDKVQKSIELIMRCASFAERVTGVAQPALMDLINRSITLLYERSRDQQPHSHWCRVWSIFVYRVSLDELRVRCTAELDEDDLCRVDFLGLAAWYGLDKFVEHILDSQSGWQRASTMDYVLGCTIDGPRFISLHLLPRLSMITALLKRGADPNTKVLEDTMWNLFLRILFDQYGRGEDASPSEYTQFINTVLAFLENEANVNEKPYCNLFCALGEQEIVHLEDSPPVVMRDYSIKFHLSARWILQQCFAKIPEFSEIEDILIASGAYLYGTSVEISIYVDKGGDYRWVDPKPSEEQLNQVTNAWEKVLTGDPVQERKMFERQLVGLFREFDLSQLFEQARLDEESGSKSSYEKESQEDRSSTDTGHVSNSPSTDAPSSPTPEAEGPSHSARSFLERD